MDFLVSVIGNAVVDPKFRERLLANPCEGIDAWGFRLTKGEVELLEAMFGRRKKELQEKFEERQKELEKKFQALEDVLYKNLEQLTLVPCDRPCRMSVSRPLPLKKVA